MTLLQINWYVMGPLLVLVAGLLIFMVRRNQQDKQQLEQKLNEDYPKPKAAEHSEDPDDLKGS